MKYTEQTSKIGQLEGSTNGGKSWHPAYRMAMPTADAKRCSDGIKTEIRMLDNELGIKRGDFFHTGKAQRYEVREAFWQRLGIISSDQCFREGVSMFDLVSVCEAGESSERLEFRSSHGMREAFAEYWNKKHRKPGTRFEDSPEVFVVSFVRVK